MSKCAICGLSIEKMLHFVVLNDEIYCETCFNRITQFREMMMTEMIICGLSMEMEAAKEHDGIGKCNYCLYFDELNNGSLFCRQYDEVLDEEKVDCPDWIVDHR